jgi:hypothetical protein
MVKKQKPIRTENKKKHEGRKAEEKISWEKDF